MRRVLIIGLIALLLAPALHAQDSAQLLSRAAQSYDNGAFQAAADDFEMLWKRGVHNGPVAYNLGNCYFKLNRLGPAVLFYERAAQYLPGDDDVLTNLAMAKESIVDSIEPREPFFLLRWWRLVATALPGSLLQLITALSFAAAVLSWAMVIWTRNHIFSRRLAVGFLSLWLVSAIVLLGQIGMLSNNGRAVIMAPSVSVVSAPNEETAVPLFVIHEGLTVQTDQRSGDMVEIVLPDGKVGWVSVETLVLI